MTGVSPNLMQFLYGDSFKEHLAAIKAQVDEKVAKHVGELSQVVADGKDQIPSGEVFRIVLQCSMDVNAIIFDAHAKAIFGAVAGYVERVYEEESLPRESDDGRPPN